MAGEHLSSGAVRTLDSKKLGTRESLGTALR